MTRLMELKVGFIEVEIFNLGLIYNAKTIDNYDDAMIDKDRKVVMAAMQFKKSDEVRNRSRLMVKKRKWMLDFRVEIFCPWKMKKCMAIVAKMIQNVMIRKRVFSQT